MKIKNIIPAIVAFFGSLFVSGLLALLPIILTVALFGWTFKMLKNWLRPIYLLEPEWMQQIPFSEFMLALLAILLVGFILNVLLLKSIFHLFDRVINTIPIVRPVYTGFKQLLQAFGPTDKQSFKHVVLIEFPRQGTHSLGFVTSEISPALAPDTKQIYYSIFIPTAPMPTNGFFLIASADQIKIIDLSRQEAMALIISGGIIQPERFSR